MIDSPVQELTILFVITLSLSKICHSPLSAKISHGYMQALKAPH